MIAPFGSDQFIVLPVEDELPVARYAAVWSKITELKISVSVS